MKKRHYKFSTLIIWVITLLFVLSTFMNLVGISGTLKYFLAYFLVLMIFFGLSLWLKRDWICHLPSYALIAIAPLSIVLTLIFDSGGDSFGRALIVIIAIVAIILAGISFLLSKLFITYVIQNEELNLRHELISNSEPIIICIGIIVLVNLVSYAFRGQDIIIFFIIIIWYSFLMFLGSLILSLILYAYNLIGKVTSLIGLLLMMIYLPFSFLIHREETKFFIILGFSIWLIFGTLLMIGLRKKKNKRLINSHEEGEIYD
ncbi:MAG: hypothetical protein K9L02_05550 [Acholeplasmataceae bacterium]|nr:hypothetical protein [Acholeplasmataceae bacterium]